MSSVGTAMHVLHAWRILMSYVAITYKFNTAVVLLLSCLFSYTHLFSTISLPTSFCHLFQYNDVRASHTMQVSGNTVNNLAIGRGQKGRGRRKEEERDGRGRKLNKWGEKWEGVGKLLLV